MELCSHHHNKICYDGFSCPLCASMEESSRKIDELESTVKEYESGQKSYETELTNLQAEIDRLYRGQADSER